MNITYQRCQSFLFTNTNRHTKSTLKSRTRIYTHLPYIHFRCRSFFLLFAAFFRFFLCFYLYFKTQTNSIYILYLDFFIICCKCWRWSLEKNVFDVEKMSILCVWLNQPNNSKAIFIAIRYTFQKCNLYVDRKKNCL